ncbi:MAG: PEP-CTERM sorting domain-containing protein [Terriglobales bacterium]
MRTASFSLLTILCLLLFVAPAMADILYSNGPHNGTTYAWTINFGYAVSDSFTVPPQWYPQYIDGFHFVYWDASTSDVLTTVDMAMGSTSFGADLFSETLTGVTNTFLGSNQYGYYLFQADYTFVPIWLWGQGYAGYVTLQNACTTSGCSVSNPIYWDENSGPSMAYENTLGSIASEAFTLTGGMVCWDCWTTPEPSSIMLFGSGILGLAGVLRRKLSR